ncbi:THAP domain-containing protein [Phthorimaea operculella]|nr:THAP domain-containing protein [Phthorimaea operculella]
MPSCVLRYCTNNTNNSSKCRGITFHRFPPKGCPEREKWIKFIQKDRSEKTWLPSDFSRVCSMHFREEDIRYSKTGRRFLKKCAVPCIDVSTEGLSRKRKMDKVHTKRPK